MDGHRDRYQLGGDIALAALVISIRRRPRHKR